MNKFRKGFSLTFIALTLLVAACASSTPKVRINKDASANFASYKTFAWLASEKQTGSSLSDQRVRSAVIAALQSKGYVQNETNPDYRVTYTLNIYRKPKDSGMRIGLGAGGGSGNVAGGVGLSIPIGKRSKMAGTLTLDIIDAQRNAQVWTASYESDVEPVEVSELTAQKMVSAILEKWPNRAAASP